MYKKKINGGSASSILRNFMSFVLTIFNTVSLGIVVILYLLCIHLPLAIWSAYLLYTYFYKCPDDLGDLHKKTDFYNNLINDKSTVVWKGLVKVFVVIFNLAKTVILFIIFFITLFFTILIPYIFLLFYFLFVYLREKCRTEYNNSEKPLENPNITSFGQIIDFQSGKTENEKQ
jgi:hypothetical protein